MRKYLLLIVLVITVHVMTMADYVVQFKNVQNSKEVYDTTDGGYRYFIVKSSPVLLDLALSSAFNVTDEVIFQLRGYHTQGQFNDLYYSEKYDIIHQNQISPKGYYTSFSGIIPMVLKENQRKFLKLRCYYKKLNEKDADYKEVDYKGLFPIVITTSEEDYNKNMRQRKEYYRQLKSMIKDLESKINTDEKIKPPIGYASLIEDLRIRETPSLQGKIVGLMKRYQTAEWLGEESSRVDRLSVNGVMIEDRWVKVRTLDGAITGWVWKGLVSKVRHLVVREMGISFYVITEIDEFKEIPIKELFIKSSSIKESTELSLQETKFVEIHDAWGDVEDDSLGVEVIDESLILNKDFIKLYLKQRFGFNYRGKSYSLFHPWLHDGFFENYKLVRDDCILVWNVFGYYGDICAIEWHYEICKTLRFYTNDYILEINEDVLLHEGYKVEELSVESYDELLLKITDTTDKDVFKSHYYYDHKEKKYSMNYDKRFDIYHVLDKYFGGMKDDPDLLYQGKGKPEYQKRYDSIYIIRDSIRSMAF